MEYIKQMEKNLPFVATDEKILFINNLDSFVYNLVNYICTISNAKVKVVSNTITLAKIKKLNPDKIILSPGPGHPKTDGGNMLKIIHAFKDKIPILGVCLGHQAITEAFGEDPTIQYVGRAKVGPKHGKLSKVFHNGEELFKDIPNPCSVVRYHSLSTKADLLPQCLKIVALAEDGTIMAIKHREYPIFGVQFHPESIMMKPYGIIILKNFLEM